MPLTNHQRNALQLITPGSNRIKIMNHNYGSKLMIFFKFRHTLDGAANLLNNSKYFPSRVSLKLASVTKLGSVSRRIYRIFSHAYFHHRQIFLDFEVSNSDIQNVGAMIFCLELESTMSPLHKIRDNV